MKIEWALSSVYSVQCDSAALNEAPEASAGIELGRYKKILWPISFFEAKNEDLSINLTDKALPIGFP